MENDIDNEEWKDIVGYEEIYQVSNLGRVKSVDRITSGKHGYMFKKGIIIKQSKNRCGYFSVHLSKNGNLKRCTVHRLVLMSFLDNSENKPQVNHINGDKCDNILSNLEWNTRFENMQHASKNGLLHPVSKSKGKFGAKSFRGKSISQYDDDMNILATYCTAREAGMKMGIHETGISQCANGKFKHAGGYRWKWN